MAAKDELFLSQLSNITFDGASTVTAFHIHQLQDLLYKLQVYSITIILHTET